MQFNITTTHEGKDIVLDIIEEKTKVRALSEFRFRLKTVHYFHEYSKIHKPLTPKTKYYAKKVQNTPDSNI